MDKPVLLQEWKNDEADITIGIYRYEVNSVDNFFVHRTTSEDTYISADYEDYGSAIERALDMFNTQMHNIWRAQE